MDDVQKALKERYSNLHPLIFQRSLEKAKNNSELFDILETVPEKYPIVWDDEKRAWVFTDDLLQLGIKNPANPISSSHDRET